MRRPGCEQASRRRAPERKASGGALSGETPRVRRANTNRTEIDRALAIFENVIRPSAVKISATEHSCTEEILHVPCGECRRFDSEERGAIAAEAAESSRPPRRRPRGAPSIVDVLAR